MIKSFYIFIMMLFFLWSAPALAQEPLIFAGIENSSYATIIKRVIREAYKRLGKQVQFSDLPAARALVLANSGKVDGELYRIKNIHLKYKNLLMLPIQIGIMEGIAITKNPKIHLQDWASMEPYRFCIRNGVKFAEKGTQNMNVDISNSNEQLFKKLGTDRCDVIIIARLTSIALAQDFEKTTKISVQGHVVQTYPLFHYIHKKERAFSSRINKNLEDNGNRRCHHRDTHPVY